MEPIIPSSCDGVVDSVIEFFTGDVAPSATPAPSTVAIIKSCFVPVGKKNNKMPATYHYWDLLVSVVVVVVVIIIIIFCFFCFCFVSLSVNLSMLLVVA